jgi:HEAT repeat protein
MLDLDQLSHDVLALDTGDDAGQREAMRSLGRLSEPEWVTVPNGVLHSLVASLRRQLRCGGKSASFHKEVATILGNLGPRSRSAVPQLVGLLQEGVPDTVREAAATALGKLGEGARDAVDQLVVLASGRTALAVQAVAALSDIGCADHRVRHALTDVWFTSAPAWNGRMHVALALCKLRIGAEGLLEFLTNALVASEDASVRKSAAAALAWCGKSEVDVVPALLAATRADTRDDVRAAAQAGLDRMGLLPEEVIRLCLSQLETSSIAETALRKSGPQAVPALIEALGKGGATARAKAARLLGCLGGTAAEAVPELTAALQHSNPEIRLAAAKGLWNVTQEADRVVPTLVRLLGQVPAGHRKERESRRRFLQTVIEALQRIGPPAKAAVPALVEKTKDGDRLVGESARYALSKIVPPGAPVFPAGIP